MQEANYTQHSYDQQRLQQALNYSWTIANWHNLLLLPIITTLTPLDLNAQQLRLSTSRALLWRYSQQI